ncbi:hypothetical protein Pcac1_g17703 [Phytophthora cactorum]|nr:hypothetical protein Pcac1_g17703 [Phytophthora cactorum]
MKKQKCTYTARREETQKLRQEVQRLTSELQELHIRSLSPEDAALLDPACGGEQPHDDTGKEPAAQRRECTVHAGRGKAFLSLTGL